MNRKEKKLNNQGMGVVGVLISGAVGAIIFYFMTDMLIAQQVSQKAITQKLEIIDFSNNFIATLAKENNCTCQFSSDSSLNPNHSNYGNLKFDSTDTTGAQFMNVDTVYTGCKGGTFPPLVLANKNAILSSTSSIIVDSVKIINLKPSGGVNTNDWQGQWEIAFKYGGGGLLRPVKPLLIMQKFVVDPTTPSSTRISSCGGIAVSSGTSHFLPQWGDNPGTLIDSLIFQSITNRIGINTTTPTHKLTVYSPVANDGIYVHSSGAGGNGGEISTHDNAHFNVSNGRTTNPTISMPHYGLAFPNTPSAAETWVSGNAGVSVFTTGGERLRVDTLGNVGIGTTAPTTKLDVAGPIKPGHASRGTGCPGEGALAYDISLHKPMFCGPSGTWELWVAEVPAGTWCGLVDAFGWYNRPCMGTYYPPNCPSGYAAQGAFGSNSDNTGTTCVKQ